MRERAVAEPKRSGMNVPCPPRAETSRCCGRTDRRVGPLGRHKVAPELSPSKTVEGFLAAGRRGGADDQPDGILRRAGDVGHQARSRRQGLGHPLFLERVSGSRRG